jgi:large subunit ribosomal protein L29
MTTPDWNTMSDVELVHHELQLERDMLTARFQLATNQLEDSSVVSKLRRGIARARTAQRAREIVQGLSKDQLRNTHRGSFAPGESKGADGESSGGFLQGIVDKVGGSE